MINQKENLSTTKPFNHSTSTNPTVSVIMNCLNCEKYLKEAINSVYAQTYKNWEIIFWDNASTDRSAEIAQSYNEKLRYFRGEKTIPLGAARNKAIEQARGEFIAFLDCDDLWMPEKLEKQVPLFDDPQVGIVYSLTKKFNSDGFIDKDAEKFNEKFTMIDFGSLLLFESYGITMSSAVISRAALYSLSLSFDQILQYAEEYDLFLRIGYSYNVIRLNEYQTHYRIHPDMCTVHNFKLRPLEREYIISKMKLLYPDFEKKYSKVLYKLENELVWIKFLCLILEGRNKSARRHLMPHIGKSFKYFVSFLLSFFGSKIVKTVWDIRNRNAGNPPIIS